MGGEKIGEKFVKFQNTYLLIMDPHEMHYHSISKPRKCSLFKGKYFGISYSQSAK